MNFLNWTKEEKPEVNKGVILPDEAESLIKLAENIVRMHTDKGAESPFPGSLAAEISFKVKAAKQKHEEGMKYARLARETLKDRDVILGTGHENSESGSLKFYLQCARDIVGRGGNSRKENEAWGFIPKK